MTDNSNSEPEASVGDPPVPTYFASTALGLTPIEARLVDGLGFSVLPLGVHEGGASLFLEVIGSRTGPEREITKWNFAIEFRKGVLSPATLTRLGKLGLTEISLPDSGVKESVFLRRCNSTDPAVEMRLEVSGKGLRRLGTETPLRIPLPIFAGHAEAGPRMTRVRIAYELFFSGEPQASTPVTGEIMSKLQIMDQSFGSVSAVQCAVVSGKELTEGDKNRVVLALYRTDGYDFAFDAEAGMRVEVGFYTGDALHALTDDEGLFSLAIQLHTETGAHDLVLQVPDKPSHVRWFAVELEPAKHKLGQQLAIELKNVVPRSAEFVHGLSDGCAGRPVDIIVRYFGRGSGQASVRVLAVPLDTLKQDAVQERINVIERKVDDLTKTAPVSGRLILPTTFVPDVRHDTSNVPAKPYVPVADTMEGLPPPHVTCISVTDDGHVRPASIRFGGAVFVTMSNTYGKDSGMGIKDFLPIQFKLPFNVDFQGRVTATFLETGQHAAGTVFTAFRGGAPEVRRRRCFLDLYHGNLLEIREIEGTKTEPAKNNIAGYTYLDGPDGARMREFRMLLVFENAEITLMTD